MTLGNIFFISISLFLAAVAHFFAFTAHPVLGNSNTLWLLMSIGGLLMVFLYLNRGGSRPLFFILLLNFIPGICQRALVLLWRPDNLDFQMYFYMGTEDLNRALTYILFGLIAAGAGYLAGDFLTRGSNRPMQWRPTVLYRYRHVLLISIIFQLAIELFMILAYKQVSMAGAQEGAFLMLSRFIVLPVCLITVMILGRYWRDLDSTSKQFLVLAVVVLIFSQILRSRKSALLIVPYYWLVLKISAGEMVRITRRAAVVLAVLAAVFVGFYWNFSQAWRATITQVHSQSEDPLYSDARASWEKTKENYAALSERNPVEQFMSLSRRLGAGLDSDMAILGDKALVDVEDYLRLWDIPKIWINSFWPGEIFPGTINQMQAFPIVYRGATLESTQFHGEGWGNSIHYAYFGWWLGLIATFFISLLTSAVYGRLRQGQTDLSLFVSTFFMTRIGGTLAGWDSHPQALIYGLMPFMAACAAGFILTRVRFVNRGTPAVYETEPYGQKR